MSSLYLTPKLPFERIGFACLALTVTTQKANARSFGLLVHKFFSRVV